MKHDSGEAGISKQRQLGKASLIIGVVALVLSPASIIGMIVAVTGLISKDQEGRRGLDWVCLLGLAVNAFTVVLMFQYILSVRPN